MELQPITYDDACEFARKQGCGFAPSHGWKYGIAMNDGKKIVGVITVGRPSAHYRDDGRTLEVSMCCTDGTKDVDAKLYEAAWRAANSLGYKQLITYTIISDSKDLSREFQETATEPLRVTPEERSTLNSILKFPKLKKDSRSDIENLRMALEAARKLFGKLGHQDWVVDIDDALNRMSQDDFSFVEDLWHKFARDVDDLILIAPHLHDPPLSEEEADALNGELAEVATATFSAIDKIRDTKSSFLSSLL
jgi:hypothetical protein